MCFGDTPEVALPARLPPEVLTQVVPKKKTAIDNSRTNTLAIGTKRDRNSTGLGPLVKPAAPSGIANRRLIAMAIMTNTYFIALATALAYTLFQ